MSTDTDTDIDLSDDLGELPVQAAEPRDTDATAPTPVVLAAPDDDLWPSAPPKGLRIGVLGLVLGGLAIAGLGFAGGAVAYEHQHPVTAVTTNAGAQQGAGAGAAGVGGQGQRGQGRTGTGGAAAAAPGGAPNAAGGATFGTVKSVDGTTIYVTDQGGNLVKVTLPDGTTVSATRPGTAADVRPGDTVVVQGAKQPDGSTQAATVSVNPQTGGGFARNAATATSAGG